MNVLGLIFLLIAHYFTGRGCIKLFKVQLNPVAHFCLSMMVGVPIVSLAPCVLQLLHIPLVTQSVAMSVLVCTIIFSIPLFINMQPPRLVKLRLPELYEWPFIIVCFLFVCVSLWRCFYLPPYARDMLSGPELLAEFAVREKTLINSVYTVELSSTNNYFKSPYITTLQVIYKLLVSPFGQIWMSVLFVSFIVWLYTLLRERIHPLLASFLLMFFMIIPDTFAYSYVMLYDYSTMVFYFAGFYFLVRYLETDRFPDIVFSAFLFGLATYIRTETLVLVAMLMPMPALYYYRRKLPLQKWILPMGIFIGFSVFFYVLCIDVFVKNFVPFAFDVSGQINHNLSKVSVFFQRFADINSKLIFSALGLEIYGYYIYTFYFIVIVDAVLIRRFNREARNMLYGVAVVYVGLALLGYLIPLVDLMNTTKRGLEKALPIMLLYYANSPSLQKLSQALIKWEADKPDKPVKSANTKPTPKTAAPVKGKR